MKSCIECILSDYHCIIFISMKIRNPKRKSLTTKDSVDAHSPGLPTIKILSPINLEACKTSYNPVSEIHSTRFEEIVDNIGLLSASFSPTCLSLSPTPCKNRVSRINLSDIMGRRNCQKFSNFKKIFPLKKKQQKKEFINEIKNKFSLLRPDNPVIMDRNTQLRMKMEDDKAYLKEKLLQSSLKPLPPSPSGTRRKRVIVLCV